MSRHDYHLEELIHNLEAVDESPKDVAWIMKEGIYLPNHCTNYNELCDLILGYYDQSISLIELKGSRSKRAKAKQQIQSGLELVRFMGYEEVRGKIVYYSSKKNFQYDTLKLQKI